MKIIVSAGNHDRRNCPVSVTLTEQVADGSYVLKSDNGETACQVTGNEALFVVKNLPAGKQVTYELGEARQFADCLEIREKHCRYDESLDIYTYGKLFTRLHISDFWTRPFMQPVMGPTGVTVTRTYPILLDYPGETKDHHHHKSFWTAWGDLSVGDVKHDDDWSELWTGHGSIRVKKYAIVENGPVRGKIVLDLDWISTQGIKMMEEERTLVYYQLSDGEQAVDLKVQFKATEGDITFGDTKEGGICAIRVASTMDGDKGGVITNACGGVGESETWGKRSEWCDYCGPLSDGSSAGICIMDNPANFRHPTYWHVRDYGLMTANPFGLSQFYNDPAKDGSYTLKANELFTFQYRVFIHAGTVLDATVANRYHDYINPPKVTC